MRTIICMGLLSMLLAACGDDTTKSTGADLSVAVVHDLAGQPIACSASDVSTACASSSVGCQVCDLTSGSCARVCSLTSPGACPTGQTCREFTFAGDGGSASGIVMSGAGCGGFGYCR